MTAGDSMTEARAERHRRPGRRRTPFTVSFSGLDGAGKTRQIDALVASLGSDTAVEVLWIPFKIWPEALLNRLPAGFRSRLGPRRRLAEAPSAEAASAEPTQRRRAAAGVRRGVWSVIGTFAAVSGALSLRRRAHGSTADVVVLDRYRLDTLVKLQFWYADVPGRWLAAVVRLLVPAPDVEILLRVDPAVAYARKPEQWSVDQLSRQARRYDVLAGQVPGVVVLDATRDPEELAQAVVSRVGVALDGR